MSKFNAFIYHRQLFSEMILAYHHVFVRLGRQMLSSLRVHGKIGYWVWEVITTAILKPQYSYTSHPKKFLCNQDPSSPYKTRRQSSPPWTGTDSWVGLLRFACHWRKWKNLVVLWHPNSTLTSYCQFSLTTSKYTLIFLSEVFTDWMRGNQKEIKKLFLLQVRPTD